MKIWKALDRQEVLNSTVAPPGAATCSWRGVVARRMTALGVVGAVAGGHKRASTTIPA